MKTAKMTRWFLPLFLVLVILMGTASQAFAQPADEKIDVLITFAGKPDAAEKALIENEGGRVKRSYHIVPTVAASIPKGRLDSLRRHPKVAFIEEDTTVRIIEDAVPWGVNRIDADAVHAQNKGQGVRVAVLDTGIDLDHPDLAVAGNVTFVYGTASGDDDNGHGTVVAGVIAALDNNIGVVGVAPEVELYAVKVADNNGAAFMSSILAGIEWAADNSMQVINISVGSPLKMPSTIVTALDRAYQSGIVLVAGAGNGGDQGILYTPSRYESVIAVGATDQQDARASFSSTGVALELMAPGVGIMTTSRGGGYSTGSGTSFSTPHVSGVAALLIASGVTNGIELRRILQDTATDLGAAGRDTYYGYGLVNAARALAAAGTIAHSDTLPPVTRIGIKGIQGERCWYRSDVAVELTAADNAGGSGVAEIQYSLDEGKTWQKYNNAPFVVASEGVNNILARAHDRAGNIEATPATAQVNIDKTQPVASVSANPDVLWPANHKEAIVEVLIAGLAEDKLSGVNYLLITVKDEYGEISYTIEQTLQAQVQLEAWRNGNDLDGRVYTISFTATDYAGNRATAETKVTVPHDRGRRNDRETTTRNVRQKS